MAPPRMNSVAMETEMGAEWKRRANFERMVDRRGVLLLGKGGHGVLLCGYVENELVG